jgi:fucose permease
MSRRWSIFAITSAHFFLSQFYRTSNAVIAPQLVQDLSLTTEALGLMSASFFYAFALTQIPLSLFLDKIGARRVMTVLSLLGIFGAAQAGIELVWPADLCDPFRRRIFNRHPGKHHRHDTTSLFS